MEHEMNGAAEVVERLAAAAAALEQTVERLQARQDAMQGEVQRIVATVELGEPMRGELERKLREAESQIAELKAQAGLSALRTSGRKTLPASTANMLAKQGISTLDSVDAGALDAAMSSLSIEQRIAVKSQLLRAGLL